VEIQSADLPEDRLEFVTVEVGLYTRISEDLEGSGLGVARQEEDCRKLADLRGWSVSRVYQDNDVSAFKTKVVRPEFELMLSDLERSLIDGVVVYDLDRFARQPVDLERAIKVFDARAGLKFATVQSDIDLSSPDGRTMARVMVAFANKASMDTSRRVRRKHLELAQKGLPVGGNRPFGYKKDKTTLEPNEAALLQAAASDLLAGVGLHTICRRWNEAGILTTVGNPWRKQVLRNLLLSPRLAGYRVYQGGIARDPTGRPIMGQYPPILDMPTWEAVCAVLRDPARCGKHVHVGGRKYLLSGLVRCSECGAVMHGNANDKWNTFSYACKVPTSGGCGKVAITGPKLDALITDLILRYLADRNVTHRALPWPGDAALNDATEKIAELMREYRDGGLSANLVFPNVRELEDQVARLRDERSRWLSKEVALQSRPIDVADAWPAMDIDQRRLVIQSVLSAVVVRRAARRGGRFDPNRVKPVWI
jgi:DNA invertase Pin-like site-specific DNA recombinase